MAFLLSLFFGICVFATILMVFQHFGLGREQPRGARPGPAPRARPMPSPSASGRREKKRFSLFGAIAGTIAGLFASLRGKKEKPQATEAPLAVAQPNTPQPVQPLQPMQPVQPLQPIQPVQPITPLADMARPAAESKPDTFSDAAAQPMPSRTLSAKSAQTLGAPLSAVGAAAIGLAAATKETAKAEETTSAPAKDEEKKPSANVAPARHCPLCGASLASDAAFCGECGWQVNVPTPAGRTDAARTSPSAMLERFGASPAHDAAPEAATETPAEPSANETPAEPGATDVPAASPKADASEKDISSNTEEAAKEIRPKADDAEPSALRSAALPAAAAVGAAAVGLAAAAKAKEPAQTADDAAPETERFVEDTPKESADIPEPKTAPETIAARSAMPEATPSARDEAATTITTLRGSRLAIKHCDTDADLVPYPFERIYTQPARLSSFTVLYFLQANGCTDSVIEVGIAPVEDGRLKKATSFFVRPPYNDFNSRKTRLALDDVKNSPTFAELWPTIEEYIRENVVAVYGAAVHLACLFSSLANFSIERPSFVAFDIKETVQALQPEGEGEAPDLMTLAKKGEVPLDKDNAKECAEFAAQLQLLAFRDNPKLENRMMLFADRETIMEQLADGALAPESVESEGKKLLAEIEGKPLAESVPALAAVEGALLYETNAELAASCATFHERYGDAEGAALLRELAATKEPMDDLLARVQMLPAKLSALAEQ